MHNTKIHHEQLANFLATAQRAATAAADIVQRKFKDRVHIKVSHKTGGEVVTEADVASEECIRTIIAADFPDHDILGEEGGLTENPASLRWFVDPLDGTENFVKGNPNFAISIALADHAYLLVGVIVAPLLNVQYEVIYGGGAYKNKQPIQVNDVANLKAADTLWCEGHEPNNTRAASLEEIVAQRVRSCARIGSAALECASVAEGTHAAYFTTGIKPWDVAAGKLLIEEAGGTVTAFDGKPYRLVAGDFLASNGRVHQQLVTLLTQQV